MNLKSGEHQIILRISFATVLEADNTRRVIEIKANINSDFHLCAKSFISEFLTPAKLVNLTSLGLSFDHWFLSSSTLLWIHSTTAVFSVYNLFLTVWNSPSWTNLVTFPTRLVSNGANCKITSILLVSHVLLCSYQSVTKVVIEELQKSILSEIKSSI